MTFSSLGLSAELERAVSDEGYASPTPVQAKAIPAILDGRDLMVSAQTGTGKTAAFILPLLHRLADTHREGRRDVRALVLAPTRELAAQVGESARRYGRHLPLRAAEVYGGMNIQPQIKRLRDGVDVLIATPGRLLDHLMRGTVSLSSVEVLVLDEADRMLDMGFLPAIERILGKLPMTRQTLLFSATFSDPIRQLARRMLRSPQIIDVARRNAATEAVVQSAYLVDAGRKRELLSYLIGSQNLEQVLVFTRTKRGADRLARQLGQDGIEATAIHGDKSQGARNRALAAFKRRAVRVLVATDVASRGLDIDHLPNVVNFELPHNPEDYVHRIGRTGRAGRKGAALSLICAEERGQFSAIRRLLKSDIAISTLQGFEPKQRPVGDVRGASQAADRPGRLPRGGRHRPTAGGERRHGRRAVAR